jgi:hypothetical protein
MDTVTERIFDVLERLNWHYGHGDVCTIKTMIVAPEIVRGVAYVVRPHSSDLVGRKFAVVNGTVKFLRHQRKLF